MEIKTLIGINPITVMEAFNEGFSDYIIPVQLTAEQWAFKTLSENVQWELSVGAFDEKKLVGFMLHGSKTNVGQSLVYNGGTAVIPSHRGQRLTQKMHDYILPILRAQNVDKVILEVIDTNEPAIKTYDAIGFKNTRRLLCFKGNYSKETLRNDYEIKALKDLDWTVLKSFWDITPSWQNDTEAIMFTPNHYKTLGIYHQNSLAGYLVYNPINNKILQLAIAPNHRRNGLASALLHEAFSESDKPLVITNIEDTAAPIIAFLKQLGLVHFITQNEMELAL